MVAVTTPDYPNIRRSTACPCCSRVKEAGCIVCWPCYRLHDVRGGIPKDIEAVLRAADLALRIVM